MSLIKSKSFDGNHELVFNDVPNARDRYKIDGVKAVGVTTFIDGGLPTPEPLQQWKIEKGAKYAALEILDIYDKQQGEVLEKDLTSVCTTAKTIWKKERDAAAGVGTTVHDYAYHASLGNKEQALEILAEQEGTEHWKSILNAVYKVDDFLKETKDEIVLLETIVASPTYKFGGKFDRLVKRDGIYILSDYKTSAKPRIKNFIQDAAYSIALKEWLNIDVKGFEVINFTKDGGEFKQTLILEPEIIEAFKQQALGCLSTYRFIKQFEKDKRFK